MSLDSPLPLEEQIYQQLRHAVASGRLAAGQGLPSVRQLASDLGVHWNTVSRAYRRLGAEGLLHVRQGRGVVVRGLVESQLSAAARARGAVREKLRDALTEARLAGLGLGEVRRLLDEQALAFKKETP